MKLSTVCLSLFGYASATTCQPSVKTKHGTLLGGTCDSQPVNYFSSIPYAAAPVGERRYAAPRPYGSFGRRNATVKAPACPQFGTTFLETGLESEDCLFLDVWAPSKLNLSSPLPVLVWLYGGSEEAGGISNPMYNGCASATDHILVSINYRLGPLGFLSLQDAHLKGNYGTQDIFLALEWVKANIAAFGGNSEKILLFGQSAGAYNTMIVASSPRAKSLISGAIMMSAGGALPTLDQADPWSKLFASSLNCSTSDLQCLRSQPVSTLQSAVLNMPAGIGPSVGTPLEHLGRGLSSWGPVFDGEVIPVYPSQSGLHVPTIVGFTANEGSLFVLGAYQERFVTLNQTDYDVFLESHFGSLAHSVNTTYPLSNFPPSATSPNPVAAAIQAITKDSVFHCQAYRALRGGIKNGKPVFTYSFGLTPSCTWLNEVPQSPFIHAWLGAAHTADIPFVFGTLTGLPLQGSPNNCSLTSSEGQLSSFMRAAWTNMAKQSSPGSPWPRFDGKAAQGINITSSGISVGAIDYSICDFWAKLERDFNITAI